MDNGDINVTDCILWNNGDDVSDSAGKGPTVLKYCDVEDGDNAGTNGCISADPKFLAPSNGDYGLGQDSPCRNAGTNLSWMTANAVDLAGFQRVYPTGGTVDTGAYEGRPAKGTVIIMQ